MRQISHRVGVVYMGRVVETGPTDEVFGRPRHPYTRALLAASPATDPRRRGSRALMTGEPPSPLKLPSGCRVRTRCPLATDLCAAEAPPVVEVGPGHTSECHYPHLAAELTKGRAAELTEGPR